MNEAQRKHFDKLLEQVLAELPTWVVELLEEVPLLVEDCPSREVLRETEVDHPDGLCGLYSGIPLTEPEARRERLYPDQILIYRRGIMAAAADDNGHVDHAELQRQIRITVLHEIGHHHGLSEEDLADLGYA